MIAHVVVAGEVGGAERMLLDLASQPGHFVILMTPSERLRALLRARLEVVDRGPAREDPLAMLRRSLGRRDVVWIADVMKKRGARIAHLHTFGSQVVGTRAARRANLRIVRTEHSTRVFDDPSCWPFSRWSLRRVHASVCISAHVREVALAKAPWAAPKMSVIPNGVDVGRFDVRPLPEGPLRAVIVGRLEPRKGVDRALDALAKVPGLALDVAGDGESRAELEKRAASLGVADRVRFLGYQSDVRDAIARAHFVLSASRKEGLGIALLEAMAMGRAAVALPTGGIPEIVDGASGWLGDDLSALLRAAVADPGELRRRGESAAKRVRSFFSIEAMKTRYQAVYDAQMHETPSWQP